MGGPVRGSWVVGRGSWVVGRGSFFHVSKHLQSNEKQTTTTTAKDIFFIVFSVYRDMKNKRQKQDHRTQKNNKINLPIL